MLRIRFHGRGGHGTKTASRIVGSAAVIASLHAQDSPIYGAERRGAPIAAFTRLDRAPIRERGPITNPHLIIVADETLIADPLAGVLRGHEGASAVFVNTESAETLARAVGLKVPIVGYDLTGRTARVLGSAAALSAGMAAAAARLCGLIDEGQLMRAAEEEFGELEMTPPLIEKNLAIARDVYAAVTSVTILPCPEETGEVVMRPAYEDPERGAPSILHPGNAELKLTGDWRVERPEIRLDGCTKCGLCAIYCPDGAITVNREGFPVIDYDHCKGCMICRQICPPQVIDAKKEVKAW